MITSTFITQKFVNRCSPQFMSAKEFLINSESPFTKVRIWIRSLTNDYLLIEETMPPNSCDFSFGFDNFFSTFNTMSLMEVILFDNCDRKVHATLSYRDYCLTVVPVKNKKKMFLCQGPACTNKNLDRQLIYSEGGNLIIEPRF